MHMGHCIVVLESIISQFKWHLYVIPIFPLNYPGLSLVLEKNTCGMWYYQKMENKIFWRHVLLHQHLIQLQQKCHTNICVCVSKHWCLFHNTACCKVLYTVLFHIEMVNFSKILVVLTTIVSKWNNWHDIMVQTHQIHNNSNMTLMGKVSWFDNDNKIEVKMYPLDDVNLYGSVEHTT